LLYYDTDLPGVAVDSRISIIVTNSHSSFSWDDYGFNLHIPQDSLPPGVPHSTLDLIASSDGEYRDQEWFSPVYWVRPNPLCRFQKPLTLEIQHCAKVTSTTELTFVKASCSQEKLPYEFREVKEKGVFSSDSSFGSVEVHGFSGYAITGRSYQSDDIEMIYIASFFYLYSKPTSIDIYFNIAPDQKVFQKVNLYLLT